jgi:5-methylthioadenosine/S-adenosylhomocysteine deaminase
MGRRLLFRNATVLTMDPALRDLRNCDVLIEGSRIAAVRPRIEATDAVIIDATEKVLLPGFVDTHRHTWQSLLRNTAVDWSLGQYFAGVRAIAGGHYTAEDMYVANYSGALEALESGITTLYDWSHNNNSPDHSDAAVRGLIDARIRAVYGYGNANKEWLPVSDLPTDFEDLKRIRARYFASDSGLLTLTFAARGPQYTTLDVTQTDFRTAHDLGLRITVHAGSGLWGMQRPVEQLHSRALLYPETIYVHGCTLAEDELTMIRDSGGYISCSPEVELNMGHGWPATLRALQAGLRPTISIDVTTSISGDMFNAMRAMMGSARGLVNAQALLRRKIRDRPAIESRELLEFATLDGARACGLDGRIGSLTPGKQADLIVLDCASSLNLHPLNYAPGAVVTAANPGNVEAVLVAGEFVKKEGRLTGVDMPGLRRRIDQSRDKLFARAGIPRNENWMPQPHLGGSNAEVDKR